MLGKKEVLEMIPMKLRAVATAMLMGLTTAAVVGLCATPAAAATVRPVVGNPLNDAKKAMAGGNCQAAMAAVRKAEGAGNLSADERKFIDQMKNYIATASKGACGADTAVGAQAKFAADWRARRYRDVIADAELLRKYGAYNAQSQQVVAQAYYGLRDYAGCLRATSSAGGTGMLELRMRCAYDGHNDDVYRAALEQLVISTNKPEFWVRLFKNVDAAKALSDQQTLDIYRVKLLTGNVRNAADYNVMTTFALQFGFAAEAQSILEAGIKANVLNGARAQRLLKRAQDDLASNLRNLPRVEKEARTAKTGDLLIKLGQDYCGMGRGKDAVAAVQAGIGKGVADMDGAQIRLGHALYCAGQKPQAVAALAKVKGSDNNALIAKLWTIYIKTH